jgi:DtxR family Mn-dependent transcriptional regulator
MAKSATHGNVLTAVMEDYLEAIFHIVREQGYARSTQISQRLDVHKSTVTTALHWLQTQGFIDYAPYRDVTLTPKGAKEAEGIVRRHDILFRLLHLLLGVEKEEASQLACDMEHALTPAIADRFIPLVEKALRKYGKAEKTLREHGIGKTAKKRKGQ